MPTRHCFLSIPDLFPMAIRSLVRRNSRQGLAQEEASALGRAEASEVEKGEASVPVEEATREEETGRKEVEAPEEEVEEEERITTGRLRRER